MVQGAGGRNQDSEKKKMAKQRGGKTWCSGSGAAGEATDSDGKLAVAGVAVR